MEGIGGMIGGTHLGEWMLGLGIAAFEANDGTGDFLCLVTRECDESGEPNGKWLGKYRWRIHEDEDVFNSDDPKHSERFTLPSGLDAEGVEERVQALLQAVSRIGRSAGPNDYVPIKSSDEEEIVEKLEENAPEGMHMVQVDPETGEPMGGSMDMSDGPSIPGMPDLNDLPEVPDGVDVMEILDDMPEPMKQELVNDMPEPVKQSLTDSMKEKLGIVDSESSSDDDTTDSSTTSSNNGVKEDLGGNFPRDASIEGLTIGDEDLESDGDVDIMDVGEIVTRHGFDLAIVIMKLVARFVQEVIELCVKAILPKTSTSRVSRRS